MSQDGNLHAVHGRGDLRAEERLVAFIIRVGDEGDAGGEKLRAGRFDADVLAVLDRSSKGRCFRARIRIAQVEGETMIKARVLAGFELGLGDCRLEGDVPQAWSFRLVGFPAFEVAQECGLGDLAGALADGLVVLLPIY